MGTIGTDRYPWYPQVPTWSAVTLGPTKKYRSYNLARRIGTKMYTPYRRKPHKSYLVPFDSVGPYRVEWAVFECVPIWVPTAQKNRAFRSLSRPRIQAFETLELLFCCALPPASLHLVSGRADGERKIALSNPCLGNVYSTFGRLLVDF